MIIRQNNSDNIKQQFLSYLESFPISPKTFRNYKSDISHFTAWLIFKIRSYGVSANSLTDSVPFIKTDLADEYKTFLVDNKEPVKTINRRLSTLRHLAKFLLNSQSLDFDFMYEIQNIRIFKDIKLSQHPIIAEFEKHLKDQNITQGTVRNYVSDVRQFFSWLETNQNAHSTLH